MTSYFTIGNASMQLFQWYCKDQFLSTWMGEDWYL